MYFVSNFFVLNFNTRFVKYVDASVFFKLVFWVLMKWCLDEIIFVKLSMVVFVFEFMLNVFLVVVLFIVVRMRSRAAFSIKMKFRNCVLLFLILSVLFVIVDVKNWLVIMVCLFFVGLFGLYIINKCVMIVSTSYIE